MDQLAILDPRTIISLKLKQLIERTPLDSRLGLSAPFQAKVKKISAVYVPIEPEEVLLELLIKARSAPKKNWKMEETNYLVYVIDKYCLANDADVDLLDCADWQNISEYLPGRTADSCQFRFLAIIPSSVTDTPWNHPER